MSLISIHNFVAPFKNTTHIITIVLIAALVGAFRYSGGSVGVAERGGRAPDTAPLAARAEPEVEDPDEDIMLPDTSKNDVIDDMLGRDSGNSREQNDPKKELEALQKKLGLK